MITLESKRKGRKFILCDHPVHVRCCIKCHIFVDIKSSLKLQNWHYYIMPHFTEEEIHSLFEHDLSANK